MTTTHPIKIDVASELVLTSKLTSSKINFKVTGAGGSVDNTLGMMVGPKELKTIDIVSWSYYSA